MLDPKIPTTIRSNAELVVASMKRKLGVDLNYDRESVAWVDQHIDTIRESVTEDTLKLFVSMYGSYLGCCMIEKYGGEWREEEGKWAVVFDNKSRVYPLVKVSKRFENGPSDSILNFYEKGP